VEASKHYPHPKKQWVEFLGERELAETAETSARPRRPFRKLTSILAPGSLWREFGTTGACQALLPRIGGLGRQNCEKSTHC
jgi:hypothetical protein